MPFPLAENPSEKAVSPVMEKLATLISAFFIS